MSNDHPQVIWSELSTYRGGQIPYAGLDRINDNLPADVNHLKVSARGKWLVHGGDYFAASVANFESDAEICDHLLCGDRISIQFILDGDFDFNLVGRGRYCLTGGRAVIFVCPPGARMERTIASGVNCHVGLAIPLKSLIDEFAFKEHDLRPEVLPILCGDLQEPLALEFQISTDQRTAIMALFNHGLNGRVGKLFTDAKLMELACLSLPWLGKNNPMGSAIPCMRDKESYALEKAVHMLDARRGESVSVRQLSRQVGLNRNKLSIGFRDRFGTTPARYARKSRLQRAVELLSQSDLSIFEIALEAGFGNQSSFSRAFRREFGCTPSEHRAR